MKMICLVTHGLGDWYLPLTLVLPLMEKHGIAKEDLTIYVDSVYGAFPERYVFQRETGIKMLETITKDWRIVPVQYFGSDNWYGIPNRSIGPQYNDVRYDFCFYRKTILKDYMRAVYHEAKSQGDLKFICGQGPWSYEWNGTENIPLDFSLRRPLKFNLPSDLEKEQMDKLIRDNVLLIHARKKGWSINDGYFQEILNFCKEWGIKTALIGLKGECSLIDMTYDFREQLSVESTMYLLENIEHMVTSGSMYTHHRFHFNKKNIIGLTESEGNRNVCFMKEDVANPNNIIYDADKPHLGNLKSDLRVWYGV